MGDRPNLSAAARLTRTNAAAPSVICAELPAVMVPSLLKAGRRLASESVVVPFRTPSSSATTVRNGTAAQCRPRGQQAQLCPVDGIAVIGV